MFKSVNATAMEPPGFRNLGLWHEWQSLR